MKRVGIGTVCLLLLLMLLPSNNVNAFPGEISLGAGSYSTVLPPGATDVQSMIYQTSNVQGKMPTNDWWSNLAWDAYSEAQYPHPLAMKNGERGMRIYYPGNRISANSAAIMGWMNDIHDFTVGHSNASAFPDAKVDGFSDWFVTAAYQNGGNAMKVTYGHGSPYVYFEYTGGNPKLSFYTPPTVWHGDANSPVLGITMAGAHYALFGPSGSTWSGIGSGELVNNLNGRNYFSIAVLPDNSAATLQKFQQYAYSHVTDSKVGWSYHSSTGTVHTTYTLSTVAKEGSQSGSIFALYPHQWRNSSASMLSYTYPSVRGEMRTLEGSSFSTAMAFTGVLPSLPDMGNYNRATLAQYVDEAEAEVYDRNKDTYWIGKQLGKLAVLAPIADQVGDAAAANLFRNEIRGTLEGWFKASNSSGNLKAQNLFYYNQNWGTVIGYPASFGSAEDLNDHHFHYGYFIKAAAEIARVDKNWANAWGPMVELLIQDIANDDRQNGMFPFLRNFDPYAGHSWASGHARFGDGNNNESSSEAMNAWAGMILWGEATGNTRIRDLGIYLYTTEMNAINEYWFDVHERNHHPDFSRATASMIWGGKTVGDAVWWTGNPEEVHGINWLPITGASLYLTHYPVYTNTNYQALVSENGGTNFDAWEDLIYMYRAISSPSEAKEMFASRSAAMIPEAGNSKAHAYHWIHNLDAIGNADPDVTADYPIYAVFNKNGAKTYVVYNMTNQERTVRFSDGHVLTVPANSFNIGNGSGGGGGNAAAIPGKIEAEHYSAMHGIQTEGTSDAGGGDNVGWIDTGDWLEYEVDVQAAGTYTVKYRIASLEAGGEIRLQSNGNTLLATTVPVTGGWQNWQTVTGTVALNAGVQTLRLYAGAGGFNLNWIEFEASGSGGGEHVTDDYTAWTARNSASQATVHFTPTTPAAYVDIHYTVNGGIQQNLRMSLSGSAWTQAIGGLSSGDTIAYWFTYEKNGPQYDSPTYVYTH
ncbi:glycoside hydrolase family 81 [Xylanibacillus composti]|uniref:glucan endo-1,3-beta-D-glucosidase n=1 Tax=Xylanibacillus composti TaxID=1572762 RepID=A0A8J4H525_9BACL|nr:glycosyl hydrolase [Xylanibacillus composti]MDT9724866.1 glycoside hydrolase family 81 [Xylanibacillus composti]GIQ69039.1 hypothetical protein XYCOK13_18630 [Xylanibacillus composti]